MIARQPIGYVIGLEGVEVTLNLLDRHRGMVAAHSQGVSTVTEIGSLLGIDVGHRLLVLKVLGVSFAEPKEVHRQAMSGRGQENEPLRNLSGVIVGVISKQDGKVRFVADSPSTPALGAMVYPLENGELSSILGADDEDAAPQVHIGDDLRSGAPVLIGLQDLISRHVAVLGCSGQGKSCFSASVMQQVVTLPSARVVIFDVNGEYENAFSSAQLAPHMEVARLGVDFKIPYYALGRQGIQRLLMPSEKTQRPALNFALDNLSRVEWVEAQRGLRLIGQPSATMFDDCRHGDATLARNSIEALRTQSAPLAARWPSMHAVGPLVAESYAIAQNSKGGWERNAFAFGNVSPLITRTHRFLDDDMFSAVIDTGSSAVRTEALNWQSEATSLVRRIFGDADTKWRVHIVDLRMVTHDLMPFILGALLELYAHELFRRGQDAKVPTLLVLEEAHHYLRPAGLGDEEIGNSLAYERLAKEGRKFGLAMWLSTQRPSEVSSTVLAQCNNWVCFKLNSEKDLSAVQSASEWADRREVRRIAGLARQNALAFGGSLRMPVLIKAPDAMPKPRSEDAPFDNWALSRKAAVLPFVDVPVQG